MRRVVLALLTGVVATALLNGFGQEPRTSRAAATAATLSVKAPHTVRGGLFYQGRIDILARQRIDHPVLVLGPGWTEQMQLNTIEPSPTSESSDRGLLSLGYDRLAAGDRLTVWIQIEANPANSSGRRDRSVTLRDGSRLLARTDDDLVVMP